MWFIGAKSPVICFVNLEKVQIIISPLGTGQLVFHLDWIPHGKKYLFHPHFSELNLFHDLSRMTLDELRTWIHLFKFKHAVPGVFSGWLFGRLQVYVIVVVRILSLDSCSLCFDRIPHWRDIFPEEHIASIGTRMCEVLYEDRPITLSTLGSWLLARTDDEMEKPAKVWKSMV